jgi:hypothetical protein
MKVNTREIKENRSIQKAMIAITESYDQPRERFANVWKLI